MIRCCRTALVASLLAFVGGCRPSASQGPAVETKSTEKPLTHVVREPAALDGANGESTSSGVTEVEIASLGLDLARATRSKDLPQFLSFFSTRELAKKIHLQSFQVTGDQEGKTFDGLSVAMRSGMENELRRIIENFAKQSFRAQSLLPLSAETRNGTDFLILRAIKQGGAPEYYEAELSRVDGKLKIADLYFYQHNEWWSKIIRFEVEEGKSPQIARGADAINLDSDASLREMLAACMRNDHAQALNLYQTLPRDDRERRLFLFFLIRLTGGLSNDLFQPTVAEAKRICPDDVQINVSLAGAFSEQKRWDDAIDSLQRVFDGVGGDPYLIAWTAQICLDANKKDEAKEVVTKVLNWPYADWPALAWALSNCLKRGDHSQAVELLKTMEEHFDEPTVGQIDLKKYPDFLESIEYIEWSAGK